MRYRSIAASLVMVGLGISSVQAMPFPPAARAAPRPASDIVTVDYTCGDGMHFTNAAGCVADVKPTPAPSKPKAQKRQVRKHKAVRTKKHRTIKQQR